MTEVNLERLAVTLLAVTSMAAAGLQPEPEGARPRAAYFAAVYALSIAVMGAIAAAVFMAPFASDAFRIGVAISIASAGGNTGTVLSRWANADAAFAGRMVIASALSCAVLVPIALILRGLNADPLAIVSTPLLFQALPFALAVLLRRSAAAVAQRVRPFFNRASSLLFIGAVLVITAERAHLLFEQTAITLGMVTTASAIGFLLGAAVPAERSLRRAAILTTGTRNLSLPLLLTARLGLPPATTLGVLVYGLPMFLGGIFVALAMRRTTR